MATVYLHCIANLHYIQIKLLPHSYVASYIIHIIVNNNSMMSKSLYTFIAMYISIHTVRKICYMEG